MKIFRNISCLFFCLVFYNSTRAQVNYLEKTRQIHGLDSAITVAEKQIALFSLKSDTSSIIETSLFLIRSYVSKSRYSKAEKISKDALDLAIHQKNRIREALFYQEQANINKFKGNSSLALNLYLQALEIFESQKDWYNVLVCNIDIGEFYRKLGKYEDAKSYIRNASEIYHDKQINNSPVYIRIANRMAAIYNEIAMQDSSIFYSRIALEFSRKTNNKNAEAVSLNELGFSFKNLRMWDTAISCYKEAERIWFLSGEDRDAVNAMNNRAMLYSHNHFPGKQLIDFYFEIIDIVKSKNIDFPLNSIFYEIHVKYLFMGDTTNAYKYFKQYHAAVYSDFLKSREVELNDIKERYENEKIKMTIDDISGKLIHSQLVLEQQKAENYITAIFLLVSVCFVILVIYLMRQVKRRNKQLSQKNFEKDALISEIHHRVKNNLQFVSSLINMQINASSHKEEVYSLNDASRRIRAMSLVHEMLYNHSEIDGVLIRQYLNELLESINELVNSEEIPIEFDLQIEDIVFDTSKSIALGMITSELVSNAIKYAFKDSQIPKISIILKKDNKNNIVFIVRDNGTGFIGEGDMQKKLGLRLIGIFSRQLKGDFKFENDNGLKYSLIFK